ncbi:hypothetical protein TSAR_006522 [Trichomalopsis sarcophagae]|uniref:Uncharacterized protein n=1 Tax=Trichomalopsis sarcophagae TaxID=543379 RepID=A0A232EQR0_9HYME|nr:hypothetical protein TSAR_006522 [Trichomalopsis sarcophagae]
MICVFLDKAEDLFTNKDVKQQNKEKMYLPLQVIQKQLLFLNPNYQAEKMQRKKLQHFFMICVFLDKAEDLFTNKDVKQQNKELKTHCVTQMYLPLQVIQKQLLFLNPNYQAEKMQRKKLQVNI